MADRDKSALASFRVKLGYLFRFLGRVTHYGFVPLILYLGISLGQTDPNSPEVTFRSLIWQ